MWSIAALGGRRRGRGAARLDHRGAALLHGGDELVARTSSCRPATCAGLPPTCSGDVRVLRRASGCPRWSCGGCRSRACRSFRRAGLGAVVVEPRHRGEIAALDLRARSTSRSARWCWRGCRPPARARRDRRSLIALPCTEKICAFASSRSLRSMPGPRGRAPTSIATSTSSNASSALSVATTSCSSGNAQSAAPSPCPGATAAPA